MLICAGSEDSSNGMCAGDEGGPLWVNNINSEYGIAVALYSHGGSCDGSSVAKFVRLSYYADRTDLTWYLCTLCDFRGGGLDFCGQCDC